MKKLFICLFLALSSQAHSGFLTGVAVGTAMSNGSTTKTKEEGMFFASDTYDVLTCEEVDINRCYVGSIAANREKKKWDGSSFTGNTEYPTPEEFIRLYGYSKLVKRGAAVHRSKHLIIMEVSK